MTDLSGAKYSNNSFQTRLQYFFKLRDHIDKMDGGREIFFAKPTKINANKKQACTIATLGGKLSVRTAEAYVGACLQTGLLLVNPEDKMLVGLNLRHAENLKRSDLGHYLTYYNFHRLSLVTMAAVEPLIWHGIKYEKPEPSIFHDKSLSFYDKLTMLLKR